MAIYKNTPPIVTNGLVLHLDAGSRMSYVSGSVTWYDLSGNVNNGTLTNGPGFDFNNQGSIIFDGINDYIIAPSSSLFNFCDGGSDLPFSTNTWCYINNLTNQFMLYNKGDTGNGQAQSYAVSVTGSGTYTAVLYDTNGPNQSGAKSTTLVPTGSWVNLALTYSGAGGAAGIKLYINAVQQPTTTYTLGTYTRMRVQNTNLFLGSFGNTGVYRSIQSNGRYSIFQFYNRLLSDQEILRNYNALKYRFNLT